MIDVYNLNMKDAERASEILGKAFFNYPTFVYLFPNEKIRKRHIVRVIAFLLKCGIIHGKVMAPSDSLEGISIWYTSDNMDFPFSSVAKAGFFNLLFSMNPFILRKFIRLGNTKKANRNSVIQGKYYFLDMIGVDPIHQGKGYAGLLIETELKRIDQEHLACYLETSDIRNVDYYKRYGFHCIHEYSFIAFHDRFKWNCATKYLLQLKNRISKDISAQFHVSYSFVKCSNNCKSYCMIRDPQ